MLRRLAQIGITTDAADNDDFRRVRALPGWTELEAFIATAGDKSTLVAAGEPPVAVPSPPGPPAAAPSAPIAPPAPSPRSRRSPAAPRLPPAPAPGVTAGVAEAAPDAAPVAPETVDAPPAPAPAAVAAGGEEAVALNGGPVEPVGLAYDSASRRVGVGDRRANKLVVADEVFRRVNDLIGAASAGFGTLTAIEIDSRRGDLWAASTSADGTASVHKLQLVSGRVLVTIPLPDGIGPARLADMMMTDAGTLLLLDSEGARLLTLRTGTRGFSPPVQVAFSSPTSIAPTGPVTYIAHEAGLARLDVKTGRPANVTGAPGVALTGLRRIRWTQGGLIAIQTDAGGSDRLVRIRLAGRGARATGVEPLDLPLAADGPALTLSRDAAYYIAQTDTGPVIRRVPLE
jgi:hypothetical protein